MIIRLLGEGQYEVSEDTVAALNELDAALASAVEAGDELTFRKALGEMLVLVQERGRRLADDHLGPSDLVLPPADATVEEVRALLGEEGLIPG
ncbi:MAG: hypothetical protein IRZ02_03265 [Acidothermus sp.]|nr:hypothetical protein [Acidothermus sp.]MCL6537654.1 hypothetical protein [Acidothermus sp.]